MSVVANTNGANFVYNNLQAYDQFNTVNVLPNVIQLERQSALQQSGRLPGGGSYRGNSANVSPNTTTAAILLDAMVTSAADLGYQKSGAFVVTLNGTTAVTVPLTNTSTNTNSVAGDNVFAKWSLIIGYNLTGLDGVNAADITLAKAATNGVPLGIAGANTYTVPASSRVVFENCNGGITVNAANAAVTITPTADGHFALVVCGS